ncbi:hypothetical protein MMC30_006664 [Trapelia coarctata]|nr:hypothetical protein [Trapelia coarctata]
MFSPPTVVAKPPNDPSTPTQHAQAPHPPQDPQPPALPVLQDPKQPPNNPQQTPAKSPSPITTNAASALQIGSRTLTPGGAPIIFSGTTYALAPSASVIIINGIPTALPAAAPNPTPIEVSGQALTTNAASALMIGTQTLTPGGPAITLSGTTYALAPSASALTVNGIPTQLPAPAAPIQILNQPLTTNAASFLMIGTQTLIAGGPAITISNTPISLDPSGSFLVIGSSTQKLGTGLPSSGQNTTPIPTPAPNYSGEKLTFQGTTYTADSKGDFVIGTQTLTPGGLVTVGGTRISLDRTPTVAVVGTGTQGLGGLIVQPFKAAAGRRLGWGRGVVRLVGLIVAGVML